MSANSQVFELTTLIDSEGVTFDPEQITLQGCYKDEISAYRARKLWIETLETNFILEDGYDFEASVVALGDGLGFLLSCEFLTACARYAFWRLTNNQAPEAQYVIETAHIPLCESRHEDILRAPDLRSVHDEPMIFSAGYPLRPNRKTLLGKVRAFFGRTS
jgi:hypothetical protein